MTSAFHSRIHQAIANPNLQSALDANAQNRTNARKRAFESLNEDIQELRQQAHQIRQNVITNLERYIDEFIQNAQANGMIIHQAADASQATRIVLEIARNHQTKLVAKSKSMVSEEISLNHALEEAGMQVIETDLGEYIVQLRHEPPAHIITPAVHLRRHEVGLLFSDKLGIDATDDIPTLTSAARRVLRQVFLEADVGVSGVNFGIADSGTLCILTNEGNGRMVTTLPKVHIALMGIERIVPTFKELSIMLKLLPRSATGQKLTVYTSLINAPRAKGESDGSLERHLVLLDNGRRNLRSSALAEALFCIRCGACLNVCPVFREIGGHAYVSKQGEHSPYPGPIGSVITPGLLGVRDFGQLARASSLCGACKEACPVDIDLPKLLLRIRAGSPSIPSSSTPLNIPKFLSIGMHIFGWVVIKPKLFIRLQDFAGFISHLIFPRRRYMRLPAITGWGYSKDFPKPATRSFHRRWNSGEIQNSTISTIASSEVIPILESADIHKPEKEKNLQDKFAHELITLGGEFICCTRDQLATSIHQILTSHQIHHIFTWEKNQLPAGLIDQLEFLGTHTYQNIDPSFKVGLTGCSAAIAETGTIIVKSGEGRPLKASLLPEIHLVILNDQDIYKDFDQAIAKIGIKDTSTTVLISGPSRTADIEMTLTIGVHGPKEIIVFCLMDENNI